MYLSSFGLTEAPFSISPDPRYLYMSRRHQEAMAHLHYGIQESGGFVQLTGEVGTGKTTICRCMLDQLPDNVDVALILNPQISHDELLASLCDEIGLSYPARATPKQLLDLLNNRLIETFSQGRRTVLVIDEAQMLTSGVLEQIRILTNLETTRQKLLQIILIGQPELSTVLARRDLRQLAQRITARYHLGPLKGEETAEYVRYRLEVAGCHRPVFTRPALRRVFRLTSGVPRLINVVCDRAMLGAYSTDNDRVTASMVSRAAREVLGGAKTRRDDGIWLWTTKLAVASVLVLAALRPQWLGVDPLRLSSVDAPAPVEADRQGSLIKNVQIASSGTGVSPEPETGFQHVSLSELLDTGDLARREAEALAGLLEAWRVRNAGRDGLSCSTAEEFHGLRCLRERGTWQDLESLNRVAALTLRKDGEVYYVLLTSLKPDRVTIAGRGGVHEFARSEVRRYWDGDYVLLWRAPPRGAGTIAEHSQGVDVLWLRQMLSRVPSIQFSEMDNTNFDASLKEQIMAFQESNNLRVDGVAGVRTIIRLNSIVDPDVPKLDRAAG